METPEHRSEQGNPVFLIVRVGTVIYAIPSRRVERVVRALDIHPLPQAPPEVLGLAGVGSEPVVVLDLSQLAGHGPFQHGDHPLIVVVRGGVGDEETTVGLAVDDALRLEQLEASHAEPVDENRPLSRLLIGNRTIFLLDLEALSFASGLEAFA